MIEVTAFGPNSASSILVTTIGKVLEFENLPPADQSDRKVLLPPFGHETPRPFSLCKTFGNDNLPDFPPLTIDDRLWGAVCFLRAHEKT